MGFKVSDIKLGQPDQLGQTVEHVYITVDGLYAVYRTDGRVLIQFADDPALGADQRKSLSDMAVTRAAIDTMLAAMHAQPDRQAFVRRYQDELSAPLILALQGQTNQASALMEELKHKLIEERRSGARRTYLLASLGIGAALLVLIALLSSSLFNFGVPEAHRPAAMSMWFAAAVGTVGAFFWTALAIRNREIEPGISIWDTVVDAGLRMFVGTLSGPLIYALIRIGAFGVTIGNATIAKDNPNFTVGGDDWLLLLLVAFTAGFLQHLVPNLLSKAVAGEARAGAASARSAAEDARSNERNPLGDGIAKSAVPSAAPAPEQAADDDPEKDEDDCCDRPATPELMTQDVELPEALGGVEGVSARG